MDCRLQISDLESRLKSLESTKNELTECQTQAERLRQSLDATESKLKTFEKRAIDAEGLVRVRDSIIEKQRNFSKELQGQVASLSGANENYKLKCGNLEINLNEALARAEDCERLREALAAKSALLDQLAESSEGISASGLAAANQFFKQQEAAYSEHISATKAAHAELDRNFKNLTTENEELKVKVKNQETELKELKEKCTQLETRVRESGQSDKKSRHDMTNARLIGPSLPPWIAEEKKTDPSDLEKLNKADPATLRARVLELEGQVHELNQLLTYREDVILRIYQETKRKANQVEALEVERSSLSAQVGILKRELALLRDDGPRRRGGYPPEIEIEIERLRGKRDREYQRRKRAEAEMDELDAENTELKEKIKKLEETVANLVPPKPVVAVSDPSDKNRIAELQATVNQLRMDNEAKRSELFDLRSRFDEKSAQLETLSSEMKTKERAVADLSIELSSKIGQLDYANKELESVRCRVVRGGSETERWQTDLNSVRTTNRFLSSQIDELRVKLADTEDELSALQHQMIALKKSNYEGAGQPIFCSSCGDITCNGVSSVSGSDSHATEETLEDLQRQCKSLEKQLVEAHDKHMKLNENMDSICGQIAQKDQEYKELQSRLFEALHTKKSREDKEIEDLKYQLKIRTNECKALETNFNSTQNSLSEEINSLNKVITLWTKKCSDLEEQVLAHKERVMQHEHELRSEKEAEIADLKTKIDVLESQLAASQDSLNHSANELIEIKEAEINNLNEELSILQSKLEEVSKSSTDHSELELEKDKELDQLKKQLSVTVAELQDARNGSTNVHAVEANKETEITNLKTQISTLMTQLETIGHFETDVDTLTTKCRDLEAAVEQEKNQATFKLKRQSDEADCRAMESQQLIEKLMGDLQKEQEASSSLSVRCSSLTNQLSTLEVNYESTRAKLAESVSENRKLDLEHAEAAALSISPPTKRARRTRSNVASNAATTSKCTVCAELKKQVAELESNVSDANSKLSSSIASINQLREEVAKAAETMCELRYQISTLQTEISMSSKNLTTLKHAVAEFLHQVDANVCTVSGELSALISLREFMA